MIYKRALTLSETVQLVFGLKSSLNMRQLYELMYNCMTEFVVTNFEVNEDEIPPEKVLSNIRQSVEIPWPDDYAFFRPILDLYAELSSEVKSIEEDCPLKVPTVLRIDAPKYIVTGGEKKLSIENSTFTRQSIARWFYNVGDLDKANIVDPTFTPEAADDDARINELFEQNKKLLEENERLKKVSLNMPQEQLGNRDLSKPFELIRQLIKIIEPEANFQKYSQLHSLLNGKLAGEEKLAVSRNTFQSYLEK